MSIYIYIVSADKNLDEKFLYNYAYTTVIPELQRIHGMGWATILGDRTYAMRVWLKPDRMRAYKVSIDEIMKAMATQSLIGRPRRLGLSSGKTAQSLEFTLFYKGHYNTPEQYENIIVRANSNGEFIRLGDLATVELGSELVNIYSNKDGMPSASIVLKQNIGSNASKVIEETKEKLEELKRDFPPGIAYSINYDVSKFVDASIEQVIHTLVEAFVLVSLVVFIFLGDLRSTLVPIIAVPISLVGAFIFMQMFGLSINLITLFALVLAIGVVVDDAIVVVEAVHEKMEYHGLTPYQVAKSVLGELSSAVMAITLVMIAVFVPVAFMSGPVGVFYRQFAITMSSSIAISGLIALTLSPILCAMILRPMHGKKKKRGWSPIRSFLELFNRGFEKLTNRYVGALRVLAPKRLFTILVVLLFSVGVWGANKILPSGFISAEDQGQIYAIIQTQPGSTLERTNYISGQLQHIAKNIEDVESVTSLAGYEILTEGRGSNAGTCLINLKDWKERKHKAREVIRILEEKTRNLGAVVEYFEPPAVPGYGSSDGFSIRLLDKGLDLDYQQLDRVNKEFLERLKARKELTGVFSFYAANYPQYEVQIDNAKAMQKGISIGDAMDNLNILIGSTYEQGFTRFNAFFKVYTQAAPEYRRMPSDLLNLFLPNDKGEMVPYSAFTRLVKTEGPNEINRFNLYNSSAIRGVPAKGYTTGDALKAIQEEAKTLPRGYAIAYEGLSYDEAGRGNEALYIFLIVIVFVYLVLSSQYESFIIPLAVLFSLPVGICGSFLMLKYMGLANDVYAQIGMIMLVGLLGKNAILIVEFALQKQKEEGLSILDATIQGARLRFRPILMTSFAFVAGLVPLVRATGAGAVGNRTLGSSAMGGMLFGIIFGVIIIPGLYYLFAKMVEGKSIMPQIEADDADAKTH